MYDRDMRGRARQILLVAGILWLSWLTMMLVHEGGHVIAAIGTGGTVCRVVWHPTVISRTDVRPNPHPLVEIWAGPVIGCFLPLVAAACASAFRLQISYLFWTVAGFCLIANGVYIGLGAADPVGDARDLVSLGTPRWAMALFGMVAVGLGFWIWHRVSPRFRFGPTPARIVAWHSYAVFAVAALVTIVGFVLGDAGVESGVALVYPPCLSSLHSRRYRTFI